MDQHLDPERLAAFMDGSLPRAERVAAEAHAADCPRCLQLLAAMARTDPAHGSRGWRLPVLVRWAVPLAAAAAALALWVNVERFGRESRQPSPQTAESPRPQGDVVSTLPPTPAPVLTARSAAGSSENAATVEAEQKSAAKDAPSQKRARAAAPSGQTARRADENAMRDAAAPPPPAVPFAQAPAPVAEPIAAPAAVPELPAEAARFRTDSLQTASGQVATVIIISAPDGLHRWRVRGAALERSVDGGRTWVVQRDLSGVPVLAGASPSATVVWLVGRMGTVLRSTDGERWERLRFPEAVDLVRVLARSDRDAEVTTSDGRVFLTLDGGQTWTAKPVK